MVKTKVDIISGFLGAGKTTFIRKLLQEALKGEKVVLIENEFGEMGIDGGFLKDAGIEIREMNAGCICCSLVGDFSASLKEILSQYAPDRVIIEPSGVGKLSDVMQAVEDVEKELEVENNSAVTVVDVKKCRIYRKNFGEFYQNQVQFASTIVLSRTDIAEQNQIDEAVAQIRELNPSAKIITTPISELSGKQLLLLLEEAVDLKEELLKEEAEAQHHHHHHDEGESCGCTCHGEDHGHDHAYHHHTHGHCHHGHDADEVFESWGMEQIPAMEEQSLRDLLERMAETDAFGTVIRCKGMVQKKDQSGWFHFDLVPGEVEIRTGTAEYTGKICVIGANLKKERLQEEFKA